LPFYFTKYEFTKYEQAEVDRASERQEVPLETEISDEYMTFASNNNNLNISFGSEKI